MTLRELIPCENVCILWKTIRSSLKVEHIIRDGNVGDTVLATGRGQSRATCVEESRPLLKTCRIWIKLTQIKTHRCKIKIRWHERSQARDLPRAWANTLEARCSQAESKAKLKKSAEPWWSSHWRALVISRLLWGQEITTRDTFPDRRVILEQKNW